MRSYADRHIPLLIAALFAGIAAHVPFIPWWINLWCFSLWGYLLIAHRNHWLLPARFFRVGLTLIAFGGIIASSGGTFGNEAGIGLLCLMASLKPFEVRNQRDRMITVFLAYFMVISSLFFSTTFAMTLYMGLSVVVITGLLIKINHPELTMKSVMTLSVTLALQALPLMLILFFLFPRLHGSLWGVKRKATGVSGFSSTLSPGSVSNMVKNNAVAFRVAFEDRKPSYNRLYWRGIVFQYYNGRSWQVKKDTLKASRKIRGKEPVRYHILMEQDNARWVFALDIPGDSPRGTYAMADYTLVSGRAVSGKIRYDLVSYLEYNTGPFYAWEKVSLDLPASGNPEARKLAKKLFADAGAPLDYARSVMALFEDEAFYYTLNPPPSGRDEIDDFLFKNKKGYCEHYASAFVFLMRAAGVPARIIGGYMGGEQNPYGDYMIVRQSDAHAWAEIWIESRGWLRFDPTSAVAPNRVETGVTSALSESEIPVFLAGQRTGAFSSLLQSLRFGWDSVNYQWDTKVVGYSFARQKYLLSRLGLKLATKKNKIIFFVTGSIIPIAALILIFALRLRITARKPVDPVLAVYLRFTGKLEKIGITKAPWSGPRDFAEKAASIRPDLGDEVKDITHIYIRLRYDLQERNKNLVNEFRRRVKKFRPKVLRKNGG